MKTDPIVEDIRKAGKRICAENGNDLHAVCEFLRKKETNHKDKMVSQKPRKQVKADIVSESSSDYNPKTEGEK